MCRSIGINRQQFNKYLNGSIRPSRHNLERICQFFKIDKEYLGYNEIEFANEISINIKKENNHFDFNELIDSFPSSNDLLERYEGYYFSYFHALGYPSFIVRSLVLFYKHEDRFYTKSIEHLWDKSLKKGPRNRFKYKGILHYLGDRIFLTEYETFNKQVICHSIIYPSYRNKIHLLSGITTGVSSLHTHTPKATRVEYRFLGKTINIKEAISNIGLFKYDDPDINEEIRKKIANDITSKEFMLLARGE